MKMRPNADTPNVIETEFAVKRRKDREDANKQGIADVDYSDLDHFIDNCRRLKDKDSFDTAIRILQAIKKQVLEKK
jgi:uncharacterized protein YpiB (UPF0302 family)